MVDQASSSKLSNFFFFFNFSEPVLVLLELKFLGFFLELNSLLQGLIFDFSLKLFVLFLDFLLINYVLYVELHLVQFTFTLNLLYFFLFLL